MHFERKIYEERYVLFHNIEDLGSMQCHVTSEESGFINFSYLFKVAKNESALSVFKYIEAPIRVSHNNATKNHFIGVKTQNSYLITDITTKFSAEVDETFFHKCIESDNYVYNDCKIVMKPHNKGCLSNLFYSKNGCDKIDQYCFVQVLGREINEAFIVTDATALIHTNGNLKMQINCKNYESEKILERGISRITLLPNEKCAFNSSKFSFFLHNHEMALDEFNYQISNESISAFSKFARSLDKIESKGINRNDTNDFIKLRQEMIKFEGEDISYHYAKMSSGATIAIIVTLALKGLL